MCDASPDKGLCKLELKWRWLIVALATCVVALSPGWAFAQDDAATVERSSYGVVPDETPALSIHDENENMQLQDGVDGGMLRPQADEEIPVRYSSVDEGNVTSVRDQGMFGTCWAFSVMGALESSLLAQGQAPQAEEGAAQNEPDLSERHLAYFSYHSALDPLGLLEGDSTQVVSDASTYPMRDPYLQRGGNALMAQHILASGRGAVDEPVAPYDELENAYVSSCELQRDNPQLTEEERCDAFLADVELDESLAFRHNSWQMTAAYNIAMADRAELKRAIMNYGGAAFLFYYDDNYLNAQTNSYYYYDSAAQNHMVEIVGWDDEYSADNFEWIEGEGENQKTMGATRKPRGDGAWLVKNSWGSWFGNEGYFWISYRDTSMSGSSAKATVFVAEPASTHDNIYQHDGTSGMCWNHVASKGRIANVYTAAGNPDGAEVIDAVSFSLEDVNVDYSVQVYLNLRDDSDPTSGTPALAQPVRGKTRFAGYYTVPLSVDVPLAQGTKYSVVVTLEHASGSSVGYSVDTTYGAGGRYDTYSMQWAYFASAVHPGESFEQDAPGKPWDDLSTNKNDISDEPWCCARLKALTRNVALDELTKLPFGAAQVSVDADELVYAGRELTPPVTVTYGDDMLTQDVDYAVSYGNNVNAGTGLVTVSAMGLFEGSDIQVEFPIYPADQQISVAEAVSKTYGAADFVLDARTNGDGTLSYASSSTSVATVDPTGRVSVKGAGNANIVVSCSAGANFAAAASEVVKLTVAKAANTFTVKAKKLTAKAKKLVRAKRTFAKSKAFTIRKARGKVTFKKLLGSKKALVAPNGKITVKKGCKKGSYRVRVRVRAAGDANYKAAVRTVTLTVKVT